METRVYMRKPKIKIDIVGKTNMMKSPTRCKWGVGIFETSGYGPGPMSPLGQSIEVSITALLKS